MPRLELSPKERQALKAQAHGLKPVVLLGSAGLTDAVLTEIDRALASHELVKVKVPGLERDQREAIFVDVADRLSAAPVQAIGKLLVFFRPAPEEEPQASTHPAAQQRSPNARSPKAPASSPSGKERVRALGQSTPTRRDVQRVTPQPPPRRTAVAARRAAGKKTPKR